MKVALFATLLLCLQIGMIAAEDAIPRRLADGLSAFERGAFETALEHFESARLRDDVPGWHGHAVFWEARTRTMLECFESAVAMYDRLISEYPTHPYVEEARYHRARVAFLLGSHESALRQFAEFVERYPTSEFRPNAVYWTAESLVSLGFLDDAELLFIEVTERYPESFRAEAARHRLDVIDYSRREADLIRLLEFNRAEYHAALSELERAVEERDRRIGELLAELERSQRGSDLHDAVPNAAESELRGELHLLRARAIELREAVLGESRDHE